MKSLFKTVCLCLLNLTVIAQSVTILPSGITPAGSIPKLSYDAIRALPSPNAGDMATDTTFNCLRFYDGKYWAKVTTNKDKSPTGIKASRIGGAGNENSEDIVMDTEGNSYITGNFLGTATFGNTTFTSEAGTNDIFVVKYNKEGIMQWIKKAGGALSDGGKSIAIDNFGNILITGFFAGTANFDNTTIVSAGNKDVFIAKYTNNGALVWVRRAGGMGEDLSTSMALDINGNVYITGDYNAGSTFGNKTILNMGGTDIFVAKYTSGGNFEWVKACGGGESDMCNSIAVDATGAIYITGNFKSSVAFGNTTLISNGDADIFVAKYNSLNDSWPWAIGMGGAEYDLSHSIAIDKEGNVLVGGGFRGIAQFNPTGLKSSGGIDIFLAKYTPDGILRWVKGKGGEETEYISDIGIDDENNIYVTGFFRDIIDFGDIRIETLEQADIFFAKFKSNGQLEWAQSIGGSNENSPSAIAVQPDGNIYATANSAYTLFLSETELNPVGGVDIFLFRIRD